MTPSPEQKPTQAVFDWLSGGGEMGERIRSFDWAASPLGPSDSWSPALRTMLPILLANRFPQLLWWGPHYIQFYNDPYRPIPGTKHPNRAFGRPGSECWTEIWHVIGPLVDRPFNGGPATWDEDIFLEINRYGFMEETHFTIAYSPVPDQTVPSGIGGVLATVHEITEKVVGQRRVLALRDLGARLSEARTAEEACAIAAQTLAGHDKDVPFVLIYLLEDKGKEAWLAGAAGVELEEDISPRKVDFCEAQQGGWPLAEAVQTGAIQIVERLEERFSSLPPGPWSDRPNTAVVVPIPSSKPSEPAGLMVAGVSARLNFDDYYRDFFNLTKTQLATAIANARAYEEERKRAEALAELDRAKTAFFSNVSHEFRTPLTLMMGPLEDTLARPHGLADEDRERLEVARRNSLRLLKLVNTLLDFSRIEAGRIEASYEPTDLAAFTEELASVFRSAIERAGLRLVVNCPPLDEAVYVDRAMWEKIVFNLLSNAFKFTLRGEIEVSLRPVGESVELAVRDTGTGIPGTELPRLFERFYRTKAARGRTFEGSGIGLALVQELVKLHGGTVGVESEVDRGSTFTVTISRGKDHLPADRIEAARTLASTGLRGEAYVEEALRWLPEEAGQRSAAPPQPADRVTAEAETDVDNSAPTGQVRPRILLADDNADMREYVRRLLSRHYEVETAVDGLAAVRAARDRMPDLVLTDVMMPELDGFGLLHKLRTDKRTASVPVILLSARAGEEARVEGMEAGADDYVIKPFSARELFARVDSHLRMARIRREAEHALRESEERFRLMADCAPVLIWLSDARKQGVYFNQHWLTFTGRTFHQELGEGWLEGIHPDDRDRTATTCQEAFQRSEPFRMEFRMRRADGEYRWVLDHGVPRFTEDGLLAGYIGSCVDITDHRQAEDWLREADRRKDEFLAMLGHELRNPLAGISTGAKLLQSSPPPDRRAWIEQMIERQVGQLQRLVDDLLDVTRITQGKIQLRREPIELAKSVEAAVESVRDLFKERRHQFSISLPPEPLSLFADPTRVEQILINLLTNAAKYTPEGGQINLSAERAGSDAIVRCRDTGVGIAPEMLDSVFEPFVQINPTIERAKTGLGMGLSLVKRLTEMHGGSVTASSAGPGTGSEFTLRLPALPADQQAEPAKAAEPFITEAVSRPLKILVIDDNRDLAEGLAIFLRNAEHRVVIAHDGETGIDFAERHRPDVVLLDLGLPGIDGCAVAEKIRSMPTLEDTLIIAISGYKPLNDDRTLRARFDAHLVKPIAYDQLLSLLQGKLGTKQPVAPPRSCRILLIEDNRELALLTAELLRGHGQEVLVAFTGEEALLKARGFRPEIVFCDLNLPGKNGFATAQLLRQETSKALLIAGLTGEKVDAYQARVERTPFDLFLSKPLVWSKVRDLMANFAGSPPYERRSTAK